MPRILRTIIPRIKKSIEERGTLVSLCRSPLLPFQLLREYRQARRIDPGCRIRSEFDQRYGVDTDGELDGWTYLSDLEIPSSNWIHGNNYAAIEPARFHAVLDALELKFKDLVFVDFGSGKGRALLLASELPFKKVVGIEFSPQLNAVALANLAKGRKFERRCGSVESLCMDFLEFPLPTEACVLFFFDPCDESTLAKMLARISHSLHTHPRELYVIYVAPNLAKERLLAEASCLTMVIRNAEHNFCAYKTA